MILLGSFRFVLPWLSYSRIIGDRSRSERNFRTFYGGGAGIMAGRRGSGEVIFLAPKIRRPCPRWWSVSRFLRGEDPRRQRQSHEVIMNVNESSCVEMNCGEAGCYIVNSRPQCYCMPSLIHHTQHLLKAFTSPFMIFNSWLMSAYSVLRIHLMSS